jgi:biopolymer transport protein ExbD
MKRFEEAESINIGFQIAPMIDVVFVIMLFFMVMAGSVQVEQELKTSLPGVSTAQPDASELPDDITIIVAEDGIVTMNDEEFDNVPDKKRAKALPDLADALTRLRKDAQARGSKVLVTLQTEEQAKYERVIDVLNALAKAQIANVTFTVGSEE